MNKIEKRYNKFWYDKRIRQNSKMQKFLIKKIEEHKEKDFPWSKKELIYLKNEDLAEIAVATINKKLSITLGNSQDNSDGSDTKCVVNQARNNIKVCKRTKKSIWQNSYTIPGLKDKTGHIRTIAYNTHKDDFDFFFFPKGSYETDRIEVVIEQYRVEQGVVPKFTGKLSATKKSKWFDFQCKSIEEMALKR